MGVNTSKTSKSKRKFGNHSLPRHVKHSQAQLFEMKSIIKNLLHPLANRFHFFEFPAQGIFQKSQKSKKNKKQTRKHS